MSSMSSDNIPALLIEAAKRAAHYIDALAARDVVPTRGSVERLIAALDTPLPDGPGRSTEVLAFLESMARPRRSPAPAADTSAS